MPTSYLIFGPSGVKEDVKFSLLVLLLILLLHGEWWNKFVLIILLKPLFLLMDICIGKLIVEMLMMHAFFSFDLEAESFGPSRSPCYVLEISYPVFILVKF